MFQFSLTRAPITRRSLLLAMTTLAGVCGSSAAIVGERESSSSQQLQGLAEDYFAALLDANPFWASQLGVASPAQASRLEIEISPSQRARMRSLHLGTLTQLKRLKRGELPESDITTYDVIDWLATDQASVLAHPDHLLPLDQLAFRAPFQMATAVENGLSRFATEGDFESHLARLRLLPYWCTQATRNFAEGVRAGIVHPRVILERLLPMLRALAPEAINASPYMAPLASLPQAMTPQAAARMRSAYGEVVTNHVNPAILQLVASLQSDVLPRSRTSAGWSDLPGGQEWYRAWVRSHTSTNLDPEAIHAMGLQEVATLRSRMRGVQRKYGFTGSLLEFLRWHDQRKEARPFQTDQDVLGAYRRLSDRVAAQLPRLFKRSPKARLEIRAEPELTRSTASDHYESPSLDGARPGVFYAVIPDPAEYSAPTMVSLFLHEAQPGHHYQVALAQELDLPRLQRLYFHTAYGEGWALYAETLGYPLGLYEDSLAHLGHLSMAMMRAVRLVVDTGVHGMGWSRERAMAYFKEQTGFNDDRARIQIERYIVSPGQALSYAIGRMSIERLRDEASAALGARFDLADFHDQVLDAGALPLSVLDSKIRRWVTSTLAAHVPPR
jgi:uncharacterized protein (DUF885 family)